MNIDSRLPPFAVGDAVKFSCRPDGPETVTAVDWRPEGWGAVWIATTRGPDLCRRTRYAPAAEFELIAGRHELASPRRRHRRPLWGRWSRRIVSLVLAAAVVALFGICGGFR